MALIQHGTIRKLCAKYGFIRGDNGSDFFFLPMTVEPKGTAWSAMVEGSRVQFKPIEHERIVTDIATGEERTEKGLRAQHVCVVTTAPGVQLAASSSQPAFAA
jgi:hypothetical protein